MAYNQCSKYLLNMNRSPPRWKRMNRLVVRSIAKGKLLLFGCLIRSIDKQLEKAFEECVYLTIEDDLIGKNFPFRRHDSDWRLNRWIFFCGSRKYAVGIQAISSIFKRLWNETPYQCLYESLNCKKKNCKISRQKFNYIFRTFFIANLQLYANLDVAWPLLQIQSTLFASCSGRNKLKWFIYM